MTNYIGITIGPIFDMMNLVSTPAALWATSYMFSTISKKTCEKLRGKGITIVSPFFDSSENPLFDKYYDGIGLFHDRIIMKSEYGEGNTVDFCLINRIKSEVLKEVSLSFGFKEDELSNRILFVATEIPVNGNENPIMKGGKILDSLELPRKISFCEGANPIIDCFTGNIKGDSDSEEEPKTERNTKIIKKGTNEYIKAVATANGSTTLAVDGIGNLGIDKEHCLKINSTRWPMIYRTKEGKMSIKSLPAIARSVWGSSMKKHSYYAIVRSDGDNMSKIIERLPVDPPSVSEDDKKGNPLTLTDFSKICLEYCAEAAEKVESYRGVPIYSSGDDLLAIMPCDSGKQGTIFNFVDEINTLFKNKFASFITMIENENAKNKIEAEENGKEFEPISIPSLSFGISICFKKFPLYEALDDSANLLFNIAKNQTEKNCTVIRLQKHSGQSEGLAIYNDALTDFLAMHNAALGIEKKEEGTPANSADSSDAEDRNGISEEVAKTEKKAEKTDRVLLSALYKTELFEALFKEAKDDAKIKNLFDNTFDGPEHKNNTFVHQVLPDFYKAIRNSKRILALSEDGLQKDTSDIKAFNFALRMLKFFVEKGGKDGR